MLRTVADVVAHARGGITWDQAMDMPLPALAEAERQLWRHWKHMSW